MTRRASGRVEGVVQGVGFRPYVYRLAHEEGLAGYVLNDERGVLLDVEGEREAVERFVARLPAEAPPLASDRVGRLVAAAAHRASAASASSRAPHGGEPDAPVAADSGDLRRLPGRAPRSRRPPLPLPVRQLHQLRPALHDRARRPLRPAADDDGRLHDVPRVPGRVRRPGRPSLPRAAQRVPGLRPDGARWGEATGDDALRLAAAALLDGAIVAVKGLGGYHLACRADDEQAVARAARAQAPRGQAVRAHGARRRDGADAGRAGRGRGAGCWPAASARSCSRRGAPARRVAAAVAPRSGELGVMLPYSPLHHLLLADAGDAARDDERQRLRRADRLPRRRRARAPGRASPTTSCSTTARSTRAPTTRSCAPSAAGR